MDVSIIIVNYNAGKLLQDCVESVKQMTSGVSFEVIVVDNASTDGSIERLKAKHRDVKVVRCVNNAGFGKGNNLGMRGAAGRYFLLLNPDTVLLNNAVKIMFDFMEHVENRDVAVCGANLYDESKKPTVSFGRFPTPCSLIFYSIPSSALFRINEGLVLNAKKEPFSVDYVTGADYFIRSDVLDKTGQFDENYFAYYEESDLAKRISKLGYRSVLVPSAAIMHLEGKTFKNPLNRKKIMFESSLYYLKKHYHKRMLFNLYCLLNETKFKIYKLLSPASNSSLWNEMISASKYYRVKNELR